MNSYLWMHKVLKMSARRLSVIVLYVYFVNRSSCNVQGESNFIPVYEFPPANIPIARSPYQPMMRYPTPMQSQPMLHRSSSVIPQQESNANNIQKNTESFNFSFSDLVEAINKVYQDDSNERRDNFRAAGIHDYDNSYSLPHPASYGYPPQPNYGPLTPAYHDPGAVHHVPPSSKIPLLKPDLSELIKPLSTKAAKASGLVQTLLTGAVPPGLEMTGIKDVFIDGVLKPLLSAKSSLKALIAKLIVPVISLVLINLEVLLTVWWLWDDCKVPPPPPPQAYPAQPYNFSSYR